jgi:hypothetical protein
MYWYQQLQYQDVKHLLHCEDISAVWYSVRTRLKEHIIVQAFYTRLLTVTACCARHYSYSVAVCFVNFGMTKLFSWYMTRTNKATTRSKHSFTVVTVVYLYEACSSVWLCIASLTWQSQIVMFWVVVECRFCTWMSAFRRKLLPPTLEWKLRTWSYTILNWVNAKYPDAWSFLQSFRWYRVTVVPVFLFVLWNPLDKKLMLCSKYVVSLVCCFFFKSEWNILYAC